MKIFFRLISKKKLPFWRRGYYGVDLTGDDYHVLE